MYIAALAISVDVALIARAVCLAVWIYLWNLCFVDGNEMVNMHS